MRTLAYAVRRGPLRVKELRKVTKVDYATFLTIVGTVIMLLLVIIGWFLRRIADQYDEAQRNHNEQFDKLLKRFDTLTEIIYEHKTDVEVIKTQIDTHNRELGSINNLYDRMRMVERDVEVIKART